MTMSQSDVKDLQSLLEQRLGHGVTVKTYTVKDFLPPGENYGSKIVSVDATIQKPGQTKNENVHMIAKLPPVSQQQRDLFDSPYTFTKEIFMYSQILPAYRSLEIDCGVNKSKAFNAYAMYYGSRLSLDPQINFDDDAAILLENLKPQGYYMVDRRYGCDLVHAKLAVAALARFHSLGVATKHKNPEIFEIFKAKSKCLEIKDPTEWITVIGQILDQIKCDPVVNKYHEVCCKAFAAGDASSWTAVPPEPWSTIIHADFWLNNFLFHKSEDSNLPDDIKLVDFQNYLFLSPTRELAFLLGCSVSSEVRRDNYDELVSLYYETFIERLMILNCNVDLYSRDSFDERLRKDTRIEFAHCVCMLKIVTMDVSADDPDAQNVINLFKSSEGNETYWARMRDLIIFLQERHLLDE